ncbi:MAG: iron ABC transporter permease [Hahellaceae bacterium]|nr:iron ABC transporter permease [Hahellaceae bacterium]
MPSPVARLHSRSALLISLSLVLIAASLLSLLTGRGSGLAWPEWDWQTQLILWEIRLPRTVLAAVSGAVLGLAGAVLQGWLRNPLADPGILGVSSSSALVAVVAMYFGLGSLAWSIPLAGILGALVGFRVLLMLTGKESGILLIILAGAAINAFCSAMTALLLNLAPNPFAMQDMLFWMMGSFEHRTLDHVLLVLPPAGIGAYLLLRTGRSLNILSLGHDTARSLGVSTDRLYWQIGLGCALAVGASVSTAGVIGFVGLIVPHLLRPLTRWEPGQLLLPSALGGAALLVLADILVRLMPEGPELRIGVLTALLGGPFFLGLLRHVRRQEFMP